jgi:hypothetical protein
MYIKVLTTLGIALFVAGSQCYAARFSGKLMDADCYNSNKVSTKETGHKSSHSITKTCAPTQSTTNFAVRVTSGPFHEEEGNTIKLDDTGNSMAASSMRAGSLQPDADGDVYVRVSGKLRASELLITKSLNPARHTTIVSEQ